MKNNKSSKKKEFQTFFKNKALDNLFDKAISRSDKVRKTALNQAGKGLKECIEKSANHFFYEVFCKDSRKKIEDSINTCRNKIMTHHYRA